MEIVLYGPYDPRRLSSKIKTLEDVVPLLAQPGEPIILKAKVPQLLNTLINVKRDLTLEGQFTTTFLCHGHNEIILDKATLISNTTTGALILNHDFTNTVTINNSTIKKVPVKKEVLTGAVMYQLAAPSNQSLTMANTINIKDSNIQGYNLYTNELNIENTVTITESINGEQSFIQAKNIVATNAKLLLSNSVLNSTDSDLSVIQTIIVNKGPVTLHGGLSINTIELNDLKRDSTEMLKLEGVFVIKNLLVKRIRKGTSIAFIKDSIVRFENGETSEGSIHVENSDIILYQTRDKMTWSLTDNCRLNIDDISASMLTQLKANYKGLETEGTSIGGFIDSTDTPPTSDPEKPAQPMINTKPLSTNDNNKQIGSDGLPFPDESLEETNVSNISGIEKAKVHPNTGPPGRDQLAQLIGLTNVKTRLTEFISLALVNQERAKRQKQGSDIKESTGVSRHMVFGGSPGVGKTTVAGIVAQILYEEGTLPTNNTVDVNANVLLSDHIGGASKITTDILEQARGGVLLIDEAYQLAEDTVLAKEAVGAIVAFMGKPEVAKADDLIIILAGYTEPMQNFLETTNPGLSSRFNTWIDFPDYTYQEKTDIFQMMLKGQSLQIQKAHVESNMFKSLMMYYDRTNGNARSVKNLVNDLILAKDTRIAREGNISELTNDELQTIQDKDIISVYKKAQKEIQADQSQTKQDGVSNG